jgi:ATP-dependent protease HslVU (ClpYQ) peptidase subunit
MAEEMTCIVGFVEGDKVFIGGDSAGVGGYSLTVRADGKVFRNGSMLFGFTSSFRMGQLLRWSLKVPDHDPRVPIEKYMATNFVDAVRECLKTNGFAKKEAEVESGGTFLVAYKGRLFCIQSDYQVAEALDQFSAVGCGEDIALGALFATPHLKGKERAQVALQAAERFSAGVRGPFHIEALTSEDGK